ncbi:hypothetical protein ACLOJK_007138 [Asimina triloba]
MIGFWGRDGGGRKKAIFVRKRGRNDEERFWWDVIIARNAAAIKRQGIVIVPSTPKIPDVSLIRAVRRIVCNPP